MLERNDWTLRNVAGVLCQVATSQPRKKTWWNAFARAGGIASALFVMACGSAASDSSAAGDHLGSDIATVTEALVHEARNAPSRPKRGAASRREFHDAMTGIWRTQVFQQGAWVDLIWVVGKEYAWHVVTAYADESLTTPLLRWDIVRSYALGARSDQFADGYDLAWNDEWGSLLAYVDNAGLFAQVGVADCELTPFVARDISSDNCGAPLFPFRDCTLQDFVELAEGRMTFGDPTQGDRCEQRPTRREAWSFERVSLTAELLGRLFDARARVSEQL